MLPLNPGKNTTHAIFQKLVLYRDIYIFPYIGQQYRFIQWCQHFYKMAQMM